MLFLSLAAAASTMTLPPPNPYLSQGAPAVTHNDSGASDAMPVEGPREQGTVEAARVQRISTGLLTIKYAGLLLYPDGTQATWNTNNNRVTKIRIDGGRWEALAWRPIDGMKLLSAAAVEAHLRAFDAAHPPTPADTDLVLYLLAQESLLCRAHIYLDWARLHGDWRTAMKRFWPQLPCVLVSYGHPYYLYDAPRMPCVVNAYTATPEVQAAVRACLLGEAPFRGVSPVDAFCGLEDARY